MSGYTKNAEKALKMAAAFSRDLGHGYVGTEHLLLGLLEEGNGVAAKVLSENDVSKSAVLDLISKQIAPPSSVSVRERDGYTPKAQQIIFNSQIQAERFHASQIGTEHILLALLRDVDNLAVRLLNTISVNPQKVYMDILVAMGENPADHKEDIQSLKMPRASENGRDLLIDHYSRDLTKLAMDDKLDPVIGREKEINRIIQTLSRRTKNNPCLIGEPGVGKTAIVEGLAKRIVEGSVPETIQGKRVLTLDLSGMVAGTKYRGEFEERIKKIIAEVTFEGNILLFLDEMHTLIGAGGAEGSIDASNILKPSLARGEIQLIGATTHEEYRKYVQKDAALERRFQPIDVEEPDEETSIEILNGIKSHYEEHHHVKITPEAVKACVVMSSRYISERFLPDKAIDLMDEAASKAKLSSMKIPAGLKELEEKLHDFDARREELLREGDLKALAKLREEQDETNVRYLRKKKRFEKAQESSQVVVDEEQIASVVSEWTRIPVSKLKEAESAKLVRLEKELKKRVIGQEEAVSALSRAIKRGRVGLKEKNRPIGSFLFLGPTGVGKTELSKTLSEVLFGSENALIRVDMSEYMEAHTVSKMIGSPPGYVGFGDGGQLSEKVRRNPYSVVLFDEIEKAHPDVFNILLQVLDDGRITDSMGRSVSFKNTVIIMTSNAGANRIVDPKKLGFGADNSEEADHEYMQRGVMEEVKRIFKPEFINRIDEIIVFRALNETDLSKIVTLQIKDLAKRTKEELNITLHVTAGVKKYIVAKGTDKKFGARPLKRAIQTTLEDLLAEEYLAGTIKDGDEVEARLLTKGKEERIELTVLKQKKKQ
ncbi:MAG: ATP-dependent Clp protease ATP-binding subunit [Lachnospiraceae bacterium]|nr:ATP-dependent Clp protease ATP-binding subunit [Lachnospiraceae bacterium]